LIRKLFLGSAVATVVALALLLVTVGSPVGKAQPAEATVASISTTTTSINNAWWAQLHIVAEDDLWSNPLTSIYDVRVTATAGDFGGLDICAIVFPPYAQTGCAPVLFPVPTPACYYDEFVATPCIILKTNGFPIFPPFFPTLVGPADRDITICNTGESVDYDFDCSSSGVSNNENPYDGFNCPECNTTEIELWWQSPNGFPGGTVTFTAWQGTSVKSSSITVLGAPAAISLKALRESSNESSSCAGTEVKVIAGVEYTFGNWDTNFDNNRAVLCAVVTDSNGSKLSGVDVIWTTTNGQLTGCWSDGDPVPGGAVTPTAGGLAYNCLSSGSTGNEGESATVTATAGSASASVTVEFGGNPATCTIPDFTTDLDIGDNIDVVATFKTALGNKVPDGIQVYFGEVDSGDSSGNAEIADPWQDTVNSMAQANLVAAISGLTTVYATIYANAGADATCTEALELSGDIHLTPGACPAGNTTGILYGFKPPAAGGFGTFAFCGGTYAQLLAASGCPAATSAFFYNKPSGTFAVWIPGSEVAAANAEIYSIFPSEHTPIPAGTIWTAKCK